MVADGSEPEFASRVLEQVFGPGLHVLEDRSPPVVVPIA